MSDQHHDERFDEELSSTGIIGFTVGVFAVTALVFLAMWFVNAGLLGWSERTVVDEAPLPELADAAPHTAPRLQAYPEDEMDQMRAAEDEDLASYRMLDAEAGIVQLPIDEAMRRIAESGMPRWSEEEAQR